VISCDALVFDFGYLKIIVDALSNSEVFLSEKANIDGAFLEATEQSC
jgi:hypothetical protein